MMNDSTHRWSEVVPPRNALTFAAIWDPNEGMVTFSGGRLLESDLVSHHESRPCVEHSPRDADAYDNQSQVLTIDQLALALSGSVPNSALFAMDQDYPSTTRLPNVFRGQALDDTSVMDPYVQAAWRRRPPRIQIIRPDPETSSQPSCYSQETRIAAEAEVHHVDWSHIRSIGKHLLSAAKTPFDGRIFHLRKSDSSEETSQSVDDEGYFEDACLTANSYYSSAPVLVNLNLKSAFSMTTTSTTNFVNVQTPSVCPSGHHHLGDDDMQCAESEIWSTLPELRSSCYPYPSTNNAPAAPGNLRRLRKTRHERCSSSSCDSPARPEEVLAREEYNHVRDHSSSVQHHSSFYPPSTYSPPSTPSSPTATSGLKRKKSLAKVKELVDKLTKCGRKVEDERWVCIEVTHKVTQHVL